MKLHPLERRILRTIREHALIPPLSTVVVAVSGGVDSMALMHILHALAPRLRCTLHIATLDHMLRAEESAADAQFVADEATKLGLSCTVAKRDVEALRAEWGMGIETAARRARYEFLVDTAQQLNAECVAAAHHADDQAETILLRLARGTALRGMRGMRLWAKLPHDKSKMISLIRPLLPVRKRMLRHYMGERGLHWREDSTNREAPYLRNQVRRMLNSMPHLSRHLVQVSELAHLDEDYFDRMLVQEATGPYTFDRESLIFNREKFRQYHPAVQLRVLSWAFRVVAPEVEFTYLHHRRCQEALAQGKTGKRVQLPGHWTLVIDAKHAYLQRTSPEETHAPTRRTQSQSDRHTLLTSGVAHPLSLPDALPISNAGWHLVLDRDSIGEGQLSAPPVATLIVPHNAVLSLRGRREGDRFAPPGLSGHTQKVKQWMIDRKVPSGIRDRIPLLDVNGQVAAIFWDGRWTVAEPFRAIREPNEDEQRVFISLRT